MAPTTGDNEAAHSGKDGESSDVPARGEFRQSLWIIFLARTSINTAFRLVYPFLPAIARGLGISLQAASGLVALRRVGGLAAPVFGLAGDRYGRRRTMEAGLVLFTTAGLLLAGLGSVVAAAIAFALYGVAKVLYDPAVHAYIGDTVPYRERGRAVGLVELSWSAAWLIGVPISGLLIARFGWRAPWAILALLGLVGIWLTVARLPSAHPPQQAAAYMDTLPATLRARGVVAMWRGLLRRPSVVALLLTSFLFTLALEVPFIVYGAWLETAFGLSLSAVGLASIVVGLAEATAELATATLTDRLGKRRSVLLGLLGLATSLAMLPWLSRLGLAPALGGFLLMLLTFEFGIVSLLALATELAPAARASLLSFNITAHSLGRILGALIGGWLWQWENIALQATFGAACALFGAVLLLWGVRDVGSS
jgi:predicted MFS family arabinose efflux permease